ncbi:crotonase/enoyl-CoA hydratase family protein [Pseudohaliea sp.]|uniref:crotonase/enoyl-CoA hydratase family protein n=1 Tax=Pseudohaliea sp. TaxID=2740289 RepID=UPI0032EFEEC0
MTQEFTRIEYKKYDGRVRITLNRPDKMNALSLGLQSELCEALWEADNDKDVHCVILCGRGRAFSAGYDLTGADKQVPVSRIASGENNYRGMKGIDDDAWQLERAQRFRMALFDMHKPSIAQVHGYCLAGGTDLALLSDMIIAADDATIGFPPARNLGTLPNNMWIYNIGPQWSKRLTMTGDTITGQEAAHLGLVMKSVPGDLLESEVESLADRFARIDPELLSANKRTINIALELMGARTLQRLAAEMDARGHHTAAADTFVGAVQEHGLKEALRMRDEQFGDGRAAVFGPDIRDERGHLVEDQ